jgi:hypothetical protein
MVRRSDFVLRQLLCPLFWGCSEKARLVWSPCYYLSGSYIALISSPRCSFVRNPETRQKVPAQRREVIKHVDHVLQLFRAYERATASTTTRASWNKTGFDHERRDETIHLVINERKIRESSRLRECCVSMRCFIHFDNIELGTGRSRICQ